jgi:hypothetical protein
MLVPNLYFLVAATQHPTNIKMVIRIISKLLDSSSQQKALNSWSDKQANTNSSNACLLDRPGFNTTCKKYHNSYQDSQDNFGLQS